MKYVTDFDGGEAASGVLLDGLRVGWLSLGNAFGAQDAPYMHGALSGADRRDAAATTRTRRRRPPRPGLGQARRHPVDMTTDAAEDGHTGG